MKRDVRLVASEGTLDVLAEVINGVLSLLDGAQVVEYLGHNPWAISICMSVRSMTRCTGYVTSRLKTSDPEPCSSFRLTM